MKYLLLLRHAKSCWKDINLSDHDRPLNKRGQKSAPKMGEKLNLKSIQPELIVSSTAVRALLTAEIVAEKIDYPLNEIVTNPDLYHASVEDMFYICSQCNDRINNLMLVGHNPGLTMFANTLLKDDRQYFENIPTAGLVILALNIKSWQELSYLENPLQVSLIDYDYPKMIGV